MNSKIIIAVILSYLAFNYINQNSQNFGSVQDDLARISSLVKKAQNSLDIAEKKYIIKETPTPSPQPDSKCKCGGTGVIVHGDGHKTPCLCPTPCKCSKTVVSTESPPSKEDMEKFISKAVQVAFDNYVKEYREKAAAQQKQQEEKLSPPQVVSQPQIISQPQAVGQP